MQQRHIILRYILVVHHPQQPHALQEHPLVVYIHLVAYAQGIKILFQQLHIQTSKLQSMYAYLTV